MVANNHFFVTGTDTDVGKTYVIALLIDSLRKRGVTAVGYKPVSCGDRADAHILQSACGPTAPSLDEINPIFLKMPAAPYVAAQVENVRIDLTSLLRGFRTLAEKYETVLVEGAGGWEVPLTEHMTVADLAAELRLPVLLVVNNKLGAINHTLLTLQGISQCGLTCAGIILNHVADERHPASISMRAVLEKFTRVPVLLEVMHGESEVETSFVG